MPVVNGIYLKDFPTLGRSPLSTDLIPIGYSSDNVAYKATLAQLLALGSVGLTMPSAFSVANSPVQGTGTLAVTAAGVASQYIRGDGTLGDFPTGGGGGSSVSYYLNGSVSQGTIGGNAYKEMNKTPVVGTGTDFTINADGYIAQFITDANDPASLLIPGGNWNVEMYFSASSGGGSPSFYVELYKYDGTTFTLLGSSATTPEGITNGTAIDIYYTSLAVPETVLTLTDRLAIRVYVTPSGRTITLHTEDNHLSEIVTTFSNGLTALNGLTKQTQYFAVGATGTDFAISSSVDTHTFNLPTASATNRGALSSANWTTFNNKQNAISLTTTGSSGASTFIADVLNVPNYTLSGLGGVPTSRQLTINGTAYDLSADRTWSVGTVTSVGGIAGTGISISGSPITGSGSLTITNTAPDQTVVLTAGTGISTSGTYPNFTITNTSPSSGGTVTSVSGTTNRISSTGGNTPVIDISSAYVGQTSITTLGTIGTGTWQGSVIGSNYGGAGAVSGLLKANGSGVVSAAVAGTDYMTPANVSGLYLPLAGGTLTGALIGTSASFTGRIGTSLSSSGSNFANSSLYVNNTANTKGAIFGYNDSADNFYFTAVEYGVAYKPLLFNTSAATFSSTVAINGSTVSTEGLSVQYNQAKTYTTSTAVSRWHSNESSGSQFKLNLFAIGNATGSSRVFKFQTSNEGVANDGIIAFQSDGGNVGIGTTSPVATLHANNTSSADPTALTLAPTTNIFGMSTSPGGMLAGGIGSTGGTYVWLQGRNTGAAGVSYPISLQPLGGNVLIGQTTDNGYRLQVVGSGSVASFNDTSSGDENIRFLANGTFRGGLGADANYALKIGGTGGIVAVINTSTGAYTATSDRTLKKNISDSPLALPVLNQIKIRQYNWKSDDSVEQYGVIAQELYEVAPTYVSKPKKETDKWGVSKAELVPLLIKAIQEQQAQIEELKALIN